MFFVFENAVVDRTKHHTFLFPDIVGSIKVADKHEVGDLFDNVQRVGQAAGPEHFPKLVDFIFQFACYHAVVIPL